MFTKNSRLKSRVFCLCRDKIYLMKLAQVKFGRGAIYLIAFIFALHQTPSAYINSSFLAKFVGDSNVGFIYSIASALTIFAFLAIRPILKRYGNYHSFAVVLLLNLISLLTMSFAETGLVLVLAYVVGHIARDLAFFHLDIFLEDVSDTKETGGIRGVYLSIMNMAYIIGPLLAGLIITDTDYWKVYLLGAGILIPTFFILLRYLNKFKDPEYKELKIKETVRAVLQQKDMYSIFAINSLLRFFYAWMVIYAPIYLVKHIGFTISETAFIIGIALVAFVIFEAPLGYVADKYLKEKYFLILGFIIMAITTASLSFIIEPNFWLWAGILFLTRTGASLVEVMSESYFFKKIDSSDINVMGFYRMLRPFVYTAAPLFASLLLLVIDIKFLFLVLGAFLLYGIRYSMVLDDKI